MTAPTSTTAPTFQLDTTAVPNRTNLNERGVEAILQATSESTVVKPNLRAISESTASNQTAARLFERKDYQMEALTEFQRQFRDRMLYQARLFIINHFQNVFFCKSYLAHDDAGREELVQHLLRRPTVGYTSFARDADMLWWTRPRPPGTRPEATGAAGVEQDHNKGDESDDAYETDSSWDRHTEPEVHNISVDPMDESKSEEATGP